MIHRLSQFRNREHKMTVTNAFNYYYFFFRTVNNCPEILVTVEGLTLIMPAQRETLPRG